MEFNPGITRGETKRIPSLDGLRAVSIGLVLAGHWFRSAVAAGWLRADGPADLYLSKYSSLGVTVFFVISGYLITRLMLEERERTGTISLKHFYLRRFFRIFPPFYAYVAFIALIAALGLVQVGPWDWLHVLSYTTNYTPAGVPRPLQHLWSLSMEEQFYLLWPITVWILSARGARRLSLALIAASPLIRVACYFLVPWLRGNEGLTLHTRIDALMYGCAMALLEVNGQLRPVLRRIFRPGVFALCFASLLIVVPYLDWRLRGAFTLPVGHTVDAAAIAVLVAFAVYHPASRVGRFLNTPAMIHVGVISYSLYLWQQFFIYPFTPDRLLPVQHPAINILLSFACAELSYRTIERFALKKRRSIEARWRVSKERAPEPALAFTAGAD